MQILVAIGAILAFIGQSIATGVGTAITFVTSRYFLRVAALGVAAFLFAQMWIINYNIVKSMLTSAAGTATGAQGAGSGLIQQGVQLCFCMVPSSLPEAISVMLNILIAAVLVKTGRQILYAKAVG